VLLSIVLLSVLKVSYYLRRYSFTAAWWRS